MRAFFCIPIPSWSRGTLLETARHLRAQTNAHASWVPKQNYHVTLRFLGDIDPGVLIHLDKLCRAVCKDVEPFECIIDRVGAFPSADRARVVWAGGEAPPAFHRLSQALSEGLINLGFPEARKESLVHVTLARIKGRPDPTLPGLMSELNPLAPLTMTVDHVVLMESMLTPQGAEYAPLFTARLGGTGNDVDRVA